MTMYILNTKFALRSCSICFIKATSLLFNKQKIYFLKRDRGTRCKLTVIHDGSSAMGGAIWMAAGWVLCSIRLWCVIDKVKSSGQG